MPNSTVLDDLEPEALAGDTPASIRVPAPRSRSSQRLTGLVGGVIAPVGAVVTLAILGLWSFGTPLGAIVAFSAYWVCYVALPGVALVVLTGWQRGLLFTGSVGVAVGYALEFLSWVSTQSLGVSWLHHGYPLLFVVPAGWQVWRRRAQLRQGWRPPALARSWALAAMASAVAAVAVVRYWFTTPWPLRGDASWSVDLWDHLGWVAETSLRGAPPTNPSVAEVPLQYHWFFYGHMASAHEISGVELPILMSRLFLVPLLLLVPLLIAALTSVVSGRQWAGVIAGLLGTVAAELSFTLWPASMALGGFAYYVSYSPTYLYGMVLLTAALAVLASQLLDRSAGWWLRWIPIAALVLVSTGAKGSILPVIGGALACAGLAAMVWRRDTALLRRIPAAIWLGIAAVGAAGLAAQLVLYGGTATARVIIHPHAIFMGAAAMPAVDWLADPAERFGDPSVLAWLVGYPLALLIVLAPYAGVIGLRTAWRSSNRRIVMCFLAGAVGTGFGIASLVVDPAHSEQWFFVMTLPAAAALGGWGLAELFAGLSAAIRKTVIWLAVAVPATIVVAAVATEWRAPAERPVPLLARYAVFGVAFAMLMVWLWRRKALRVAAVVLVAACLASSLLVNLSVLRVWERTGQKLLSEGDNRTRADTTPQLRAALTWLRNNSAPDAVFAVNNHCLITTTRPNGEIYCADSRVFYYSAISQRRALVESWAYTDELLQKSLRDSKYYTLVDTPFVARTELNDAAFTAPTAVVLADLRAQGVQYLFADLRPRFPGDRAQYPADQLGDLAQVVYENSDARIYQLSSR